ncbi:hypothetical protein [Poritiphilus flavus]|uniref:Uncharacterized protein n=1 Tax=Poritiphilus flavus TaxID=2697053 RepID=A0A6L9ECK8_9FLAO|nr:hypothetical protein [Poritiphilus flavus]NAS12485.1 hypothetical protein [Poritiphilus flavus]
MRRKNVLFALLAVWLFAIFAPPAFLLISEDNSSFMSYNLTEEEQPEQEKQDTSEEKIIPDFTEIAVFKTSDKKMLSEIYTIQVISNHAPDIQLPPPEGRS